jgi:hypothetical protein
MQLHRQYDQNTDPATVYKEISIDTKLKNRMKIQKTELTGKVHQGDEVPHWTVASSDKKT